MKISSLWPHIAPYGTCLWFAKRAGVPPLGGPVKDPLALTRCVNAMNRKGFDTYLGLNPARLHGIKARREDVIELRFICLDYDPVAAEANPKAAALCSCAVQGLEPSSCTILDSGRGYQVWIHLTPLKLKDNEHREQAERAVNRYLHQVSRSLDPKYGCRLDTSCSDLPRVARCPGSINSKTGRMAHLEALATTTLDPETILTMLAPEPQRLPPPCKDLTNLSRVLPHLKHRARVYLTEGTDTPGRHASAYAAARSLRETGVPQEQAIHWIVYGGSLCSPQLGPDECHRAVSSAYK